MDRILEMKSSSLLLLLLVLFLSSQRASVVTVMVGYARDAKMPMVVVHVALFHPRQKVDARGGVVSSGSSIAAVLVERDGWA